MHYQQIGSYLLSTELQSVAINTVAVIHYYHNDSDSVSRKWQWLINFYWVKPILFLLLYLAWIIKNLPKNLEINVGLEEN